MTSYNNLTELEDLRLFMQERVQAYDSSIDTSVGGSFDTAVIQPLIDRIGPDPYLTDIRAFILGRISTEFPSLVVQDGEPIDDYAVKIMQVLLQPFRRQIKQISLGQSLANPTLLSEYEADNLAANFFVRRRLGGYSVGVARVYFSSPQFSLVTPSNAVFDSSGHRFFPVENQAINADRMLFNEENGLYFFDIVVRAEAEGAGYNIPAATLSGIEGVTSSVKISNKRAFTEGGDKEETTAFLERVENSLTEKSLVTFKGITARLTDVFEAVRLIQVIGFGDPEMNRDILTGSSQSKPYAQFEGDTSTGTPNPYIDKPVLGVFMLLDGATLKTDFYDGGVKIGDRVTLADLSGPTSEEYVVEEIVNSLRIRVDRNVPTSLADARFLLSREEGTITISNIPGGILEPQTPAGTISVVDGQVHIGGALDVFVRARAPQEQNITLEGILDASPLHFGVDLESFGERDDRYAHLTEEAPALLAFPDTDRFGDSLATPRNQVVIKAKDDPAGPGVEHYPLWMDESDKLVGRFIQALGPTVWGTYEILDVLYDQYYDDGGWFRCVRLEIDTTDQESGSVTTFPIINTLTEAVRLVEKVSIKGRVRDRDASTVVVAEDDPVAGDPEIAGGINFKNIGGLGSEAKIGDSVVIETGEDAGIYSIRRILSWLSDNDTIILDRNLTKTVIPSGIGGGTGLRYRIADELNIDLVSPKVTKIPLGSIFAGDDLSTVAGDNTVNATGTTNFLLAGVEANDTLEVLEGDNAGTYNIASVTGTTLSLDAPVPNTGFAQEFSVYRSFSGVNRPLVRVREIELLDSSSQPTGITIPYGDNIDSRVLGVLSNRAEGSIVDRYTGELIETAPSVVDELEDLNVPSFEVGGVKVGHRLNILSGASAGRYTISAVGTSGGLANDSRIKITPVADGGVLFVTAATSIHYSIGLPSAGFARIYFQEPTSVEIETGLAGGRLSYEEEGTPKEFQFSEVDGFQMVPSGGSDDSSPRDLRVVSTAETSPGSAEFTSILEFTDDSRPGVFELEMQEEDILEINEQIPFRNAGGSSFDEIGVFGKPAGLKTNAGSNLVSVPTASLIDFTAMNAVIPLAGQILMIDDGPDAGQYTIEEVVTNKSLRLSSVMTATTQSFLGQDLSTPRDAALSVGAGSGTSNITDTTDGGQLKNGAQPGHYITIFDSTRADLGGTYKVTDILLGTPNTLEIEASFDSPTAVGGAIDPFSVGLFSWVRTSSDTYVGQEFYIYQAAATQVEVLQVATKRDDITSGVRRGDITGANTLVDAAGSTLGAKRGDILEIVSGPAAGQYFLATDTSGALATIFANPVFPVTISDVPFRIWGGLHGSRRMVTVGKIPGLSNGHIEPGHSMPYRVVRPKIFRVSSTEMEGNFDGSLYYVDVQIESSGSGDDLNLPAGRRLVVNSGMSVDGYTYSVENENLTFSTFEEVSLNFDRRFLPIGNSDSPENLTEVSGRNIQVKYSTSSTVRLVNDLMRSDEERPINANPLARHFLPSFVYMQMDYAGGVTEKEVGADLENYINGLGAEDEIEVSDLEAFLTKRGATFVRHPLLIVAVTHDLGRKLVVNRSDNKLGGLNTVPFNGTGRISAFFAKLGEGLKLVRES